MPVAFPAIQPTARSFKLPAWATTTSRSQSGVVSRRLWGSKPGDAELNLEFRNILDANAVAIADSYRIAKGDTDILILPSILFKNMSESMKQIMQAEGLQWHFSKPAGPPVIQSEVCGFFSISVSLIAELNLS